MRIKVRVSCYVLLLALLISYARIGIAENQFEILKARYLKLRNTTTAQDRPKDWDQLTEQLVTYAVTAKGDLHAALALYYASILAEGSARASNTDLSAVFLLLDNLVNQYPASELCDDALLRKADLLLGLGEVDNAKQIFKVIIDQYKSGDQWVIAQKRLATIAQAQPLAKSEPQAQPQAKLHGDLPVIVIDPGHGGEDFGAQGIGGLMEKDVTLNVALELAKALQGENIARVILTRNQDEFVPLPDRTAFANNNQAQLFISLHVNASVSAKLSGIETFYLDTKGDAATIKIAERENGPRENIGDLGFILGDLMQSGKLGESIEFAKTVQNGLIKHLLATGHTVKNLGVKPAPFYVLVGAHMPCVLVEMLFIDNQNDGALLADPAFRAQLVHGLKASIKQHLTLNSKIDSKHAA